VLHSGAIKRYYTLLEEFAHVKRIPLVSVAAVLLLTQAVFAQEVVDLDMVNRIRDEGLNRSEVMETVGYLTDVIGPRLTGSPGFKKANEWARDRLQEWGLENARIDEWDFGRGWDFTKASVRMIGPREVPLIAIPMAWTPGTDGPVVGSVMRASLDSQEDLDKYRGKVAGKILFLDDPREIMERDAPSFQRYNKEELEELIEFPIPRVRRRNGDYRQRALARWRLRDAINQFLSDEKVVATVQISSRDNALIRVGGAGSREPGKNPGVTSLSLAAEQYNSIMRLIDEHKQDVELEIDVEAQFYDDAKGYNTLAEIKGTDKADELVLLGGHIDSWHAGTGATDDAAGVAVAMEAVRILKVLGVQPRRTIRVALWGGEEQGYLGSLDYVKKYLATRPEPTDPEQKEMPEWMRRDRGELNLLPDYEKFCAYFNLDNGSGKIRGIYTQGNVAIDPIFEAWLEPFHDLGADTVTNQNTGGTDHIPFDRVGLPGFQFIQDELDYMSRTHHTNVDVYDHLRREDLIQASVIMASFVYNAAMRPEKLPRKPMPKTENR
jgi:hypothetical protein